MITEISKKSKSHDGKLKWKLRKSKRDSIEEREERNKKKTAKGKSRHR